MPTGGPPWPSPVRLALLCFPFLGCHGADQISPPPSTPLWRCSSLLGSSSSCYSASPLSLSSPLEATPADVAVAKLRPRRPARLRRPAAVPSHDAPRHRRLPRSPILPLWMPRPRSPLFKVKYGIDSFWSLRGDERRMECAIHLLPCSVMVRRSQH
jgi:hypothetical protein